MPLIDGVVTAGIGEATRVAQTVIHRGAEAGMVVIAGERAHRAQAERIPEAGASERLGRRPKREREGRGGQGHRHERPPGEEPGHGGLVDLQA